MMPELIKCAILVFLTQAVFMVSVFFVSGQMLPSLMSGFYAHTGMLSRTAIASVVFLPLGNFMFACAYALFSPAWVSPMAVTSFVLLSILFTVLLLGVRPSLWIVPATLTVIAGCIWVSILLEKKQS
ncbi:MAG: hypothetical protein V1721_05685 [Pseudomonadota bacterium]